MLGSSVNSTILKNMNTFSLSLGIGFSFITIYYLYRSVRAPKWVLIGNLSDIIFYPVKSCCGVHLEEADCNILGIKKDEFQDRIFMITDLNGNYMSGRSKPQITQIRPRLINKNVITLQAEGMSDYSIDLDLLDASKTTNSIIWSDNIKTVDCGEEAATWVSKALLKKESGLKLVYYPHKKCNRSLRKKFTISSNMTTADCGAFSDGSSFMIASESSLNDLNSRLEKDPVSINNFRPNLVVQGAKPMDEDNWKMIKIGNETIFKAVLPCVRCPFVTVDPNTGIKNEYNEPLKTLKTYRQVHDRPLRKIIGESPKMGVHLGLSNAGKIKIGDPVFVTY